MKSTTESHLPEQRGRLKKLPAEASGAYLGTTRAALASMRRAVELSYGGFAPQAVPQEIARTVVDAAMQTSPQAVERQHPFEEAQGYYTEQPKTSATSEEDALQNLTAIYAAAQRQSQPEQENAA